jgi:DNA-binding GntR family transcriptional regulator
MAVESSLSENGLPAFPRVASETKGDAAYEILRDSILRGVLRPGQRLKSAELARQLGVSMMPIREALKQLAVDGLVTNVPHVGAAVSPLDVDELWQMIPVRCHLEGLATRLAVARMTDADIAALRDNVARAREQAERADSHALWLMNLEFHALLWRVSGNDFLTTLLRQNSEKTERFRLVYGMLPPRGRLDVKEHQEILEAIERGSGEIAELLTRVHLQTSMTELVEYLSKAGLAEGSKASATGR